MSASDELPALSLSAVSAADLRVFVFQLIAHSSSLLDIPPPPMYHTHGGYMSNSQELSLRIAGMPTYGMQGIFIDRDDVRFHCRDERILVQSFYEGQAFLYDLVKGLSTE